MKRNSLLMISQSNASKDSFKETSIFHSKLSPLTQLQNVTKRWRSVRIKALIYEAVKIRIKHLTTEEAIIQETFLFYLRYYFYLLNLFKKAKQKEVY